MNFSSCDKVLSTIQATDEAAWWQSENRKKINNLFNGFPLLSEDDAKKLRLKINCNLGEAPVLGQSGRRQYQNAFLTRNTFFTVRIPDAPENKAADWSAFITRRINKPLKKSLKYYELQRSKWAAVLLHGYAPTLYYDRYCVQPEFVPLEDFRVPTDSRCDLSNLSWFAVRKYYTEGELSRKVFGKYADKGWNKDVVKQVLDQVHDQNWEAGEAKWADQPERLAEIIKQNGGFYSGDAVPTIPMFHFYFEDDSNRRKREWRMRVVPDTATLSVPTDKFIFDDGKTAVASEIGHLLQMQYGDLNNKPPFVIHSIRALGFLLMEPIFHSNLLDCRFLQHIHEALNVWVTIQDVQGKARAQKIDLYNLGVVPDGVTVVPNTQRHQVDPNIIAMGRERMETLKQQASVSYTQDSEPGKGENETATAVMARVSQVNAMMSGLLATARTYETFAAEETCRRFCLRNSQDDMAKAFQKACREFGIPSRYMDPDNWEVEVDMPLGAGNPTMEMAQSTWLMQNRTAFDTTAQQEILHEATIAFTNDPRKAERWAPIGKKRGVTDAAEHAELAFSTLMLGVPVQRREGLSIVDQIGTIIGLMAGVIARIEKTGNMATAAEIIGLHNCESYLNNKDPKNGPIGLIPQLEQDEPQKPLAKNFAKVLSGLMNTVKGFEQRLAEQQKKLAQQNGENGQGELMQAQAKAQSTMMLAGTKAKVTEMTAAQKLKHKDAAFIKEQQRKDAQTLKEEQRKDAAAFGEIQRGHLKTVEDVKNQRYATFNKPSKDD